MGLKQYLLAESETTALAGKFEKLCKDIEGSLGDVAKFQELDSVIETGNINVLAQLNKVKAVLGDACKEIGVLIAMVSVKEEVPEKTEAKMADYLQKESVKKNSKVIKEEYTEDDVSATGNYSLYTIHDVNSRYSYRIEKSRSGYIFTIYHDLHNKENGANSKSGFGNTIEKSLADNEWSDRLPPYHKLMLTTLPIKD